jgi:hypothetical protein
MILETDIKLMQSERLQDTEDGGGRMTGNEVVDGLSNNLFPDISELDRTYGRISLRKCFPAVLTDTVDTYYGANMIISEPPEDPLVHVSIFKTRESNAWFDERSDAQNKVESYVTQGVLSSMKMLGNHFVGQRALLAYQGTSDDIPGVGDVYVLSDGGNTQFVRVDAIEHETVTYTDTLGNFQKIELTITLSDALRYAFQGGEPNRYSAYQPTAKIYKSNVVEAIAYYGIVTLAQAVDLGDMQVKVSDIKRPLVPSTQAESAILDIQAGGTRSVTLDAGARDVQMSNVAHTGITEITSATRGYNYVKSLYPLPAVGTLEVSYRSREKWYTILDELGTGELTGDGTGRIVYETGSVMITLQDLPDVDTALLWAWSSPAHYDVRTNADVRPFQWEGETEHYPIVPGSISITWEYPSGVTKTATDNGTGSFTGDGTGTICYATGVFWLRPTLIPEAGTTPQITYDYGTLVTEVYNVPLPGDGLLELTAAQQITPYTLSVEWVVERDFNRYQKSGESDPGGVRHYGPYTFTEAPSSSFIEEKSQTVITTRINTSDDGAGNLVSGTVNYATGEMSFWCQVIVEYKETNHSGADGGSSWVTAETTGWPSDPVPVTIRYKPVTGTDTEATETLPAMPLLIALTPSTDGLVVPESVQFLIGTSTYIDRDGSIYRDVTEIDPVGTYSGTIDYETGIVTLTDWTPGSSTFTLTSLLTQKGQWTEAFMRFRTPSAPVRPGGFVLTATDINGDLITGTANTSGEIIGDHIDGDIDFETGVVEVSFGDRVLDSSLTPEEKEEPWYDPANVDLEGYIWKPLEIFPNTCRFNVVVYVYLPLDSDILGLDPVRLPLDGRVPIFRTGDVIVLHNTQTETIATPYNGLVVDCGRVRLSYAKLYDGDGNPVNTDLYTVDLDAGTVTLGAISGLTTPFALEHRIEDMALVSDLQINGTLTLTRSMSHDYATDGSYVSSAVVIGDLFARFSTLFSQATWTSVWSDELIGSSPLAQYNDAVYPIEMTNKGCIQERWICLFTSSSEFRCVGEYTGQIATGSINVDFAPINPETSAPYFTIRGAGWGSGWATGNVLRFNTVAANYPIWVARTVLQGDATAHEDRFRLQVRGDADTE